MTPNIMNNYCVKPVKFDKAVKKGQFEIKE